MALTPEQFAAAVFGPTHSTHDLEQATRVLAAATQAVEDYAAGAPDTLKDEAVIRFGGYLISAGPGDIRKESAGPFDVEHVVNHSAMFRNCGAAALLTRYRVRRAGVI